MTAHDVVLLHAFPLDARQWTGALDATRKAAPRVLTPNLPGFGGTALPDADPSLTLVAQDVLRQMDAAGIDRAVVGGMSLGGYVTMELLRLLSEQGAPERIAAIMLLDTKATADGDEARVNRLRMAEQVESDPESTDRFLRTAMLGGLLSPQAPDERPAAVQAVGAMLDDAPAATVAWYQRAMADRPDSLADLAAFAGPSLVLWGAFDGISPASEQEQMLAVLRDPTRVVVPDAGHLTAPEQPAALDHALAAWLNAIP